MIDEQNFAALLLKLGFEREGCIYKKIFSEGVVMSADFFGRKLFYPVQIKGRERNDGFEQNENFVVFECVNRLLTKGYRPEDIELERQWQLGREAKGGRADICVSSDGSVLFIIECKTWGREFNNAMTDTKDDGAQLFSYWQQEQSCKWLVLYSSDFQDGEVTYKAPTINCSDDNNLLLLAEKDTTIKLFKNSHTVPEKVEAWKETYESKILDDLIFSDEATAYNIEVKPLRKKNLVGFDEFNRDRIINQFEEILRHNNVSDKENAFNRLIALFICKLVDETLNDEDSEVKFQYKQGVDTYESLQDRLQRLHRDGMLNFMNEEIFYVEPDYPKRLFAKYVGANRKRAIADLQRTIRNLKFYSNNDFAFKDVHNEELFLQNGKVLVEMVQLFEKFRIVYNSRQQLLGDLFEKLLNKGFKQNEGQFFTPIPITRFIWDCLPVARMVESDYPKIVDYACGAGHFLTEAIEAVNYFRDSGGDNSWARDHIYGIEKDYRLARVAKISLFMNGAGEGNIIFGDGLEDNPAKGIEDGSFDVLVANPPYSVKDFIQHLQPSVKDRFALSKKIGRNGSEIETLFVERIAQLLKSRGIAAVILPSSILSNDSASYTAAREELLQNFYIRAIVSFGAKTFSATGTNTVVMFLEKFEQPPREVDLLGDFVDAIFSCEDLTPWQDGEKIFEAYTAQIGVSQEFYRSFVKRELSLDELGAHEYFKMYVNAFAAKKTNKADDERKFYSYAREIEWEKILYFALVYKQKTVIINSPADNQGQKDFLGYEWSNRRGNEGMQVIEPGGKLYNDSDRAAEGTLAAAVRETFGGSAPALNDAQRVYASVVNTRDMLDFSRVSFNKAMKLTAEQKFEFETKFAMVDLGTLADVSKGRAITRAETVPGDYKVVAGGLDFAYTHNEYNREADIITVSASGANAGYVNFWRERIFASDCSTIRAKTTLTTKYIYYYLKAIQEQIYSVLQKGAAQPHVYPDDIKLIPVPNVDEAIQQQIVAECEAVDDEYNATRMSIESYRKKIEEIFTNLDVISRGGVTIFRLEDVCKDLIAGGDVPQGNWSKEATATHTVPIYSNGTEENALYGYTNVARIHEDSVTISARGTIGYTAMREAPFYPIVRLIVATPDTTKVKLKYLYGVLKQTEFQKSGKTIPQLTVPMVRDIKIPVPPLEAQQKIIDECEAIEKKIAAAEEKLESLKGKTAEILNRYLN